MGEILGNLGIEGGLFLSQVVNFVLIAILLRMFLWEPILNMLDQRRERIVQQMKDAEKAGRAADDAEIEKNNILAEARREAQEVRAQATRDTERIAQDIRARAESEATEIRMKAQRDAQVQVDSMLADVNKKISDLTIAATEQLLGRELSNREEQRRFVDEFLEAEQSRSGA